MFEKKKVMMVVVLLSLVTGIGIGTAVSVDDTHTATKKLERAFALINQRYVDDVDAEELAETAIERMLKELDPHSVFIDADRMKRVNEDFDASFEGIGISYEFLPGIQGKDTLAVLNAIPGGPSERAGLHSGDRIVEVDGIYSVGFSAEDVHKFLKGPKGTTVELAVVRPGYNEKLQFSIKRDEIPIQTIDTRYMMDQRTGYVKMNRFARTTYKEFLEASRQLKQQGMDRMILDLRDNVGGFMDMAIRVSDEFIGGNGVIVEARSRHGEYNQQSRARVKGLLEDIPVIVLVNENSASASEIVAGALQDHDRALIVGRRTFGKGLVQKQFPFEDGSALRMTISRFYTPSGRLIQTPYTNGDRQAYNLEKDRQLQQEAGLTREELLAVVPDSLKYTTANGRTVVGGGGIHPDVVVERDSISPFIQAVVGRGLARDFVRDWIDVNQESFMEQWGGRKQAFVNLFEIDEP